MLEAFIIYPSTNKDQLSRIWLIASTGEIESSNTPTSNGSEPNEDMDHFVRAVGCQLVTLPPGAMTIPPLKTYLAEVLHLYKVVWRCF
jgi:hypothetical protein